MRVARHRARVVIWTAIGLLGVGISIPLLRGSLTGRGGFDPLAKARATAGRVVNRQATVPEACYAKTGGEANVCWTCHTEAGVPARQEGHDSARTNPWRNLFVDRSAQVDAIPDEEVLAYVRTDNYGPLRRALEACDDDFSGYVPDLDLEQGFDAEGFAVDGSGWRAIRYKPFPGAFWPTNGGAGDLMIRLPREFRCDVDGRPSRKIYKINLSLLEAAIAVDPSHSDRGLDRPVEPLDEKAAGVDLDWDGRIVATVTRIRVLPRQYVGAAREITVHRHLYPKGVEFLHPVRYLDPDRPTLLAVRMKELQYARKTRWLEPAELARLAKSPDGRAGSPLEGFRNGYGWQFQAFIEDEEGRLRLQTEEEHRTCLGCHGGVGVTVDHTFAFARKVPGAAGWRSQDLRGIKDVPQAGHSKPEILTYFQRAGRGDAFGANEELRARFFPMGSLDVAVVLRAAPGGDWDLSHLLAPSRDRALRLNKAYLTLVREQGFERGRTAAPAPVPHAHRELAEGAGTGLAEANRVFRDGRVWLRWR
ncbi:MAG: hypothetical protein ACYS6Z_11485 [Planctomycetota bacterium]|jgi:hypothetical protein